MARSKRSLAINSLLVLVVCALTGTARAGDYTFDIPQLQGHYLGDIPAVPTVEVVVDLGIEFAQIDSASLQLSGTHIPGLAGDLNSPHTFPFPAEVVAWSDRPGGYQEDLFIDELLPSHGGAFELNEQFHKLYPAAGAADYSPWLDGRAEFDFSVHTPPMLAIYYLIHQPGVTITSATLVIDGQPNLDSFMLRGDFDGDGDTDGQDLMAWQRNPGVGDLADWQASYGAGSLVAGVSVPEPGSLTFLIALVSLSGSRVFLCRAPDWGTHGEMH